MAATAISISMATARWRPCASGCAASIAEVLEGCLPGPAEAAATAAARRPAATATSRSARAPTGLGARLCRRLAGQQALALGALARQLARAAHGLGLLAHALLGGFLVVVPELHLPENALALHLLLERLEGLIDVVIANLNQQAVVLGSVVPVAYAKMGRGSRNDTRPEPHPTRWASL